MQVVSGQDRKEKPARDRARNMASRGGAASRALLLLFVVVVVAFIVIWGISSRKQANAQLAPETQDLALPSVSVVRPKPGAPQQEIVLPGDMQPFTDAPIFARTSR